MLLMSEGCGCDAGKRASGENSSTSVRTVSTEEPMVSAHCRITLQRSRVRRRAAFQVAANALGRQARSA